MTRYDGEWVWSMVRRSMKSHDRPFSFSGVEIFWDLLISKAQWTLIYREHLGSLSNTHPICQITTSSTNRAQSKTSRSPELLNI
jgi:hypothetical protein